MPAFYNAIQAIQEADGRTERAAWDCCGDGGRRRKKVMERALQQSIEHTDCGVACRHVVRLLISAGFRGFWLREKSKPFPHAAPSSDQYARKAGLCSQEKAVSFVARD